MGKQGMRNQAVPHIHFSSDALNGAYAYKIGGSSDTGLCLVHLMNVFVFHHQHPHAVFFLKNKIRKKNELFEQLAEIILRIFIRKVLNS